MSIALKATVVGRRRTVLDFVTAFWIERGYGPSVREVALTSRISNSTAFYHITSLKALGWLCSEGNTARTLRPSTVGAGWRDGRMVLDKDVRDE